MEFYQEHVIPNEHLVKVCKYRQEGCCRYIVFFLELKEFCCAKRVDHIRQGIDSTADNMKCTGDNCEGLPHAQKQEDSGASGTSA